MDEISGHVATCLSQKRTPSGKDNIAKGSTKEERSYEKKPSRNPLSFSFRTKRTSFSSKPQIIRAKLIYWLTTTTKEARIFYLYKNPFTIIEAKNI